MQLKLHNIPSVSFSKHSCALIHRIFYNFQKLRNQNYYWGKLPKIAPPCCGNNSRRSNSCGRRGLVHIVLTNSCAKLNPNLLSPQHIRSHLAHYKSNSSTNSRGCRRTYTECPKNITCELAVGVGTQSTICNNVQQCAY